MPTEARRLGLFGWSFLICVLLPTVVSTAYLGLVASPEYASEAKFTIRAASETRSSLLGDTVSNITAAIGLGMGAHSTNQDIFIVADYIRSRTIIEDLGGTAMLRGYYAQSDTDWLSRLSRSASLEKGWKYWKRKVTALIDTPSGIVTLEVRAYSRDEAHRLAQSILEKSEALVNVISERSRQDALQRAQRELQRAEDLIGKLTQERLTLDNNRATLRSTLDQNAPTLRVLNAQIDAIDKQIDGLKNQLTSKGQSTSISAQISGYENLQIEVQFAEKLYTIAQASYERARTEQEKQQLYLVTIDRPSAPEKPTYPKLLLDSATIFAACFILWSMFTLLFATVKDHMGG